MKYVFKIYVIVSRLAYNEKIVNEQKSIRVYFSHIFFVGCTYLIQANDKYLK